MRLFLPFLLLALPACNQESGRGNEQASLEYNRQQGRDAAAEPARAAREAAALPPGAGAPGAARPIEKVAGGIGQDEGAARAEPDARTASSVPQLPEKIAAAAPVEASSRSGRELVQMKCSTCHSLEIALAPRSAANWAEIMELMTGHGMVASAAERRLMQNHLQTCCLSGGAP